MNEKLTLSVEEAGKLLGVSRQVAYQLSRRSDFPTLHIGRRVLVPRKQLEAWTKGENPKLMKSRMGQTDIYTET